MPRSRVMILSGTPAGGRSGWAVRTTVSVEVAVAFLAAVLAFVEPDEAVRGDRAIPAGARERRGAARRIRKVFDATS